MTKHEYQQISEALKKLKQTIEGRFDEFNENITRSFGEFNKSHNE